MRVFYNLRSLFFIMAGFSLLLFTETLHAFANQNTPQKLGAHTAKTNEPIPLLQKSVVSTQKNSLSKKNSGQQIGETIKSVPFDKDHDIQVFTRSNAHNLLERKLFGFPQYTASYYYSKVDKNSINTESHYIQIVSDTRWNRLLYGTLNGALKSYEEIVAPGEIVINSRGQVFVAEKSKNRILVFNLITGRNSVSLQLSHTIDISGEPTSLAYNDAGTPLDVSDDFLFVADAVNNTITKYILNSEGAEIATVFKNFMWPVSIICGRSDGHNTNQLYVIDTYAKRLSVYNENDNALTEVHRLTADYNQTFSDMEVDHFGQLYIADATSGIITKYTDDLEFLDEKTDENKIGMNNLSIPFGTVEIAGDTTYWAGFDQLFALQKWNDNSGIKRFQLEPALKNVTLLSTENNATIKTDFLLTDFATTSFNIKNSKNEKIFQSEDYWTRSGFNVHEWTRKNNNNSQVEPGNYTMELMAKSAYTDKEIKFSSSFYLPLYYHINCGDEDDTPKIEKLSGTTFVLNNKNIVSDVNRVQYKFTGLNPATAYQLAVSFPELTNSKSHQGIEVDGFVLVENIEFGGSGFHSDFLDIPEQAIQDGQITVSVYKQGDSDVYISDIWLKESGNNFSINNKDDHLPEAFALEQNYPNPFNPVTTIRYSLVANNNSSIHVELSIFNLLGQKVSTLVSEKQTGGSYSYNFDGTQLPSGVYFYRLSTKDFTETRKMLLVK